ncbi:hypothetical protein K474DRAFT_1777054 [Panus rudis PR-1116 ss-1]|nr:hypothetical protein K474DRAFT_1777054 [Panus rudis PR-1116 ss-1]
MRLPITPAFLALSLFISSGALAYPMPRAGSDVDGNVFSNPKGVAAQDNGEIIHELFRRAKKLDPEEKAARKAERERRLEEEMRRGVAERNRLRADSQARFEAQIRMEREREQRQVTSMQRMHQAGLPIPGGRHYGLPDLDAHMSNAAGPSHPNPAPSTLRQSRRPSEHTRTQPYPTQPISSLSRSRTRPDLEMPGGSSLGGMLSYHAPASSHPQSSGHVNAPSMAPGTSHGVPVQQHYAQPPAQQLYPQQAHPQQPYPQQAHPQQHYPQQPYPQQPIVQPHTGGASTSSLANWALGPLPAIVSPRPRQPRPPPRQGGTSGSGSSLADWNKFYGER